MEYSEVRKVRVVLKGVHCELYKLFYNYLLLIMFSSLVAREGSARAKKFFTTLIPWRIQVVAFALTANLTVVPEQL